MKSTILSGLSIAALVICCGNCRCCSCVPSSLKDKVTSKVTEVAVQEGAEYGIEQAFGDGSRAEVDLDNAHVNIQRPDGSVVDMWGKPDSLPPSSRWPTPPGVTYTFELEAKRDTKTDDGTTQWQHGELAGIEYAAEDRDAIVEAYKKWAESEGYKVTQLGEMTEDQKIMVPGLESIGASSPENDQPGTVYIGIEGPDKKGVLFFGPVRGQVHYEDMDADKGTAFWWQK